MNEERKDPNFTKYYFPDLVKDLEKRGDDVEASFNNLKEQDAHMLTQLKSKYLGRMLPESLSIESRINNINKLEGTKSRYAERESPLLPQRMVLDSLAESFPPNKQRGESTNCVLSPVSNNIITEFLGKNEQEKSGNKGTRNRGRTKENCIGIGGLGRLSVTPERGIMVEDVDVSKSAEGRLYKNSDERRTRTPRDFVSRRVSIGDIADDSKESTIYRINNNTEETSCLPPRISQGRSRSMAPLPASSLGRKAAHLSNEQAWLKLIHNTHHTQQSPLISPQFYNHKGSDILASNLHHSHTNTQHHIPSTYQDLSSYPQSSYRNTAYPPDSSSFLNPTQISSLTPQKSSRSVNSATSSFSRFGKCGMSIQEKESWQKINNLLHQHGYVKIPIKFTDSGDSLPDSTILATTLLKILTEFERRGKTIQELITAHKEKGREKYHEITEIQNQRDQIGKLEDQINGLKIELSKTKSNIKLGKKENHLAHKSLEKSVKEKDKEIHRMNKILVTKEGTINELRQLVSTIKAEEEAVTQRDKHSFEGIFGRKARGNMDNKVLQMIKSYQNTINMNQNIIRELEDKLQRQGKVSEGPLHLANKLTELQNYIDQQEVYYEEMKQELIEKRNKLNGLEEINMKLLDGKREIENKLQELRPSEEKMHFQEEKLQEYESQIRCMTAEIGELENEISLGKSRNRGIPGTGTGTDLRLSEALGTTHNLSHTPPRDNLELENEISRLSYERAKHLLLESCRILTLNTPHHLLPGLTKLSKLLGAFPRMEKFIKSICQLLGEGVSNSIEGGLSTPLHVDKVIPTLRDWGSRINNLGKLTLFREGVARLLGLPPRGTSDNKSILDEIFRLTTLRPHDLSDARAQYRLKAIVQIEQMLGSDDPQELVKIIKDTINFTLQIKDFLSLSKQILGLNSNAAPMECFGLITESLSNTKSGGKPDTKEEIVAELMNVFGIADQRFLLTAIKRVLMGQQL